MRIICGIILMWILGRLRLSLIHGFSHVSRPGKVSENQADMPSKYSPESSVCTEKRGNAVRRRF